MKTLFAISIVALIALLWASISIAQHIRHARQRKRMLLERGKQTAAAIAAGPVPPAPIPYANAGERLDWAHFNKDFGDLTDPYQQPRTKPKSQSAR